MSTASSFASASRQLWVALTLMLVVVFVGLTFFESVAPRYSTLGSVAARSVVSGTIKAAPMDVSPSAVSPEQPRATPVNNRLATAISKTFAVDNALARQIVGVASEVAHKEQLPVTLLLAVIARESSFNPKAINSRDLGLMQVNAKWHASTIEKVGGEYAMLRPKVNIPVGARILKGYIQTAGTISGGLRRYNGLGKANNYPQEVIAYMHKFNAHR